ncbi:MAG: nuclear transport factor 2 family protein [Steroidobacteraceae bacterium]|nr:nuclear transport factor 2 family protein [Steroidobacteraceae bacterium]
MPKKIVGVLACMLAGSAVQAADLKEQLVGIDKMLWAAAAKKNGVVFKKSLTEDAMYIVAGAVPIQGRDVIANEFVNGAFSVCTRTGFTIEDAILRQLAPTVIELSYNATQKGECDGTPLPFMVRATTIYLQQKGRWLVTLHQETALELE